MQNKTVCFYCILLQDGFTTCAIRDCPVLSCKNQTNIDGACCPVCAGSLGYVLSLLNNLCHENRGLSQLLLMLLYFI